MSEQQYLDLSREDIKELYSRQANAQLIMVLGWPSTGKTASLYDVNPESTFIINTVGKRLTFPRGHMYHAAKNESVAEGNMLVETNFLKITSAMRNVSRKREEVTLLVIDDGTYIMTQEFVDTAQIRNYDKFTDMAAHLWKIWRTVEDLRPDLKVVFMGHVEEDAGRQIMQTVGKMTREKLRPEGLTDIILVPDVERIGDEGDAKYFFYTQSDGVHMARSPMGMFPYKIPNNMRLVCDRIDEYSQGVSLRDSQLDFSIPVVNPRDL